MLLVTRYHKQAEWKISIIPYNGVLAQFMS